MNMRRKLLQGLGLGALVLPGVGRAASENPTPPALPQGRYPVKPTGGLPPAAQGRGGDYFPNVVVFDQNGRKYRFFDDLIKNRVVMVNFMSIKAHGAFPVTEHLAHIADHLEGQLGREVFINSITTDPGNDTPARLKTLAKKYGADRDGWHFLTTTAGAISALSVRLRKHGQHGGHGGGGHPIRMVHYGNGGVGIWGAFGADTEPGFAAERVSWVKNGTPPKGPVHRAGPRRLGQSPNAGHNRNT